MDLEKEAFKKILLDCHRANDLLLKWKYISPTESADIWNAISQTASEYDIEEEIEKMRCLGEYPY